MTARVIADDTEEQRKFFCGALPAGRRFGHAQSAAGAKHVRDIRNGLLGRRPAGGALAEEAEPVRTRHVRAAEAAVHMVSALSEMAGTRSALDSPHPHRPWRDARTRPPPLDETLRAAPFGWHDRPAGRCSTSAGTC